MHSTCACARITESFVIFVCPSTCNNLAPTGWIFVTLYIGELYQNLSIKSSFGRNQKKITDTLHQEPNAFWKHCALSSTLLMRAHCGCRGGEVMAVPFCNFIGRNNWTLLKCFLSYFVDILPSTVMLMGMCSQLLFWIFSNVTNGWKLGSLILCVLQTLATDPTYNAATESFLYTKLWFH
jgi:hypothetical protein